MTFSRLKGSVTPLRLTTASTAVSTVVKRLPHSGHDRRRRIAWPSSASRESTTRESGWRQNGQCITAPSPHGLPEGSNDSETTCVTRSPVNDRTNASSPHRRDWGACITSTDRRDECLAGSQGRRVESVQFLDAFDRVTHRRARRTPGGEALEAFALLHLDNSQPFRNRRGRHIAAS